MKSPPEPCILLVDDEANIVRALTPTLRHAGFAVDAAASGDEALRLLAARPYDLLLLDLGLPECDGHTVIERVRQWSDLPIIVLSARDAESEKIRALDNGADDYVNKPFAIGELVARIRAALRGRARRYASSPVFSSDELEINFDSRQVRIFGQDVRLTPREYDFLKVLAAQAGKVVTHKQIITAVWGAAATADAQFVRVLVGQVRQKVEEDPSRPRLIRTEPGVGYRLNVETSDASRPLNFAARL